MGGITNFDSALGALDLSLFEKIQSETTDEDRRSLLAIELAVRELAGRYRYLEIGSHVGGSIQPHLLDPRCERIYSIDKRPLTQPDERGFEWVYQNNTTERMIEKLKTVSPDVSKIVTIDGDTRSIDAARVADKIHLCFIDGEHTDAAVVSDFEFCLGVLAQNGAIIFHDAQITYNGIAACIELLKERGVKFTAYVLPNIVFVIEIGDFALHKHANIAERLTNNHLSYLYSLQETDKYRQFANKFPFGFLRRLRFKIRGGNVSP